MKTMMMCMAAAATMSFSTVAGAPTTFTQIKEFSIPEANQGVGVDAQFFYAVDDTLIAKYTKDGSFVAKADYASIGIIHLDSATVIDDKIYCSHSNYRYF